MAFNHEQNATTWDMRVTLKRLLGSAALLFLIQADLTTTGLFPMKNVLSCWSLQRSRAFQKSHIGPGALGVHSTLQEHEVEILVANP